MRKIIISLIFILFYFSYGIAFSLSSTFIGGSDEDQGMSIAFDENYIWEARIKYSGDGQTINGLTISPTSYPWDKSFTTPYAWRGGDNISSNTRNSTEEVIVFATQPVGQFNIYKLIRKSNEFIAYQNDDKNIHTDTDSFIYGNANWFIHTYEGHVHYDWVRVRKYTEPEPTVTYERQAVVGDHVTVTFDFSEGIDKLLITVDSDCEAVYYSTDDGQTWNPINPDEETLLDETAYSVKFKFVNASYMNGYAFIVW